MRRDADPDERRLLDVCALLRPLPLRVGRVDGEDLEVDDRPQPGVRRGARGRAGEAVVGDGRDARAQRLERAEPGDREHVLRVELRLARDVRPDPRAERQPVAEAGVVRVLEVRVRVHEAGHDRRLGEVTLGAAGADLDDPPVLVADDAAFDRRPVDREDPVRRYRRGHVPTGYVARRSARRSSSTDAQIDAS